MKMNFKRGFTLIELLVVIAIIGILASVVLASLNSARTKGKDAAAISSMAQARAAAEIAYSNNSNTYTGMCPVVTGYIVGATGTNAPEVRASLFNAQTAIGAPTTGGPTVPGSVGCGASATAYSTWIKLNNTGSYCVDSTGFAGVKTADQVLAQTLCV
ncbi:hypothetical protein A2914_01190 [Candidatus Nomurabacteria bacterium RIFCSPLOWO2_01_FULL_41_21]|uniref:Type II secretion system protein GspG C-terminal domain-containing protein n=2 Tax=Candidatus Nomuraibacteriota TaxID=1752729 RepID=A0A1F6V2A5_9BACT|nr:MAG: hypothetical protein A2733_02280 [Candidatus Nomurabacteria bacterium RIFCSPHIGHO2_01_FULL_40_20]OGI87926.1 MAG: hypothetical protein A2914_01190 [Candidatus Nomurabacteria bacterium RIFCSPLOWO2_01_FULL_41_21]